MTRLFVTADIHGSYRTWMTLRKLLKPGDTLVIAGDLFDTRYGDHSLADFQPESIKQEIQVIPHTVHYVYGNCDVPLFFPGHGPTLEFRAWDKTVFLHHGHYPDEFPQESNIIIQGHTHVCLLETRNSRIHMNPGTLSSPRNKLHTYGIIESHQARIMDLTSHTPLITLDL